DLDDTGEWAFGIVCLAFEAHDLDAIELRRARDLGSESRFADTLFAADEAGLAMRGEQTVQDAFHVLHLLLASDLRCVLLLGSGAVGFGDSPSEECGGHADVARRRAEFAQVRVENLECANLAAVERGGFGECERRFFVEWVEQQTSGGEALDGCPVVSLALRGDRGDEDASQSGGDDIALTLEPFVERRRKPRRVSREKRALNELRNAVGIGTAAGGQHLAEVRLSGTGGQGDMAAIRSERGAERVEAVQGLAEAVIRALGGGARPQQFDDAPALDGLAGLAHEQQRRREQRLAGLRK